MKRGLFLGLGICALILFVPLISSAAIFSRVLQAGDSGPDVFLVQKILNTSTLTRVAASGPGSPGNETFLFGGATKLAVIKFQNLYASDILAPSGLSYGTGRIGPNTLKKFESVAALFMNHPTDTASTSGTGQASDSRPVIINLSKTTFDNGDTIVITGKNFTKNNTVILSTEKPSRFTGIASADGTTISVRLTSKVTEGIALHVARLDSAHRQKVIDAIIAVESKKSGIAGGWYVNATLSVTNENGTSLPAPVVINLIKGI